MRLGPRRSVALALVLLALLATGATPPPTAPAKAPAPTQQYAAAVARDRDAPRVGSSELARLLGATRFWRADVRRLELRLDGHRLVFSADNPYVLVDDRTVRLDTPCLVRSGELLVPVEIARRLPTTAGWPRLAYDADAHLLRVAPASGYLGAPRVRVAGAVTELTVPSEQPAAAMVVGRSRARFRLRLAGGLAGALPDSLPDDGVLRDLVAWPGSGGVTFEFALDPAAQGWRLERTVSSGRVVLSFSRTGGAGWESFAPEGAPGPRVLRTLVLDPGHGGRDAGVQIEGRDEKSLTLELAQLLAVELQQRTPARVVLTRREDRDLSQEERAETANRVQADAVLSLHFGVMPQASASGVTVWCAPAMLDDAPAVGAGMVELRPWREVAVGRAVESRGLAEQVTHAIERAGHGPAEVHERLPVALLGVQSPGVLIECGQLSNPEARARLFGRDGLRALAVAIAEGVAAWQRNP